MTEDEMVGWHHDSMDMSLSKLQEIVKNREAWHAAVHVVTKSQAQQNNKNIHHEIPICELIFKSFTLWVSTPHSMLL